MLVYKRIQTLIGREINADEVRILAGVFNTDMNFFLTEESTKPWKVEPEPAYYALEIKDDELNDKIFNKADELGIHPDELVSQIIKLHIDRLHPRQEACL